MTEPEDPKDQAYLISFGECSIVPCRGRRRKRKDPADGAQSAEPESPPPRNQG